MDTRADPRPRTSDEGPHRQLSDQSSPALWGELVARAFALPDVYEYFSSVSPATSRALLLDDLSEVLVAETSLAPDGPLEPVHLHGVTDTSIHLCLPAARATEVCEAGWGEAHQFAEFGTEIMLYGPRTPSELEIVVGLIEESLRFARESNTPGE
jgi:hypothetical protein